MDILILTVLGALIGAIVGHAYYKFKAVIDICGELLAQEAKKK